MTSEIGTDEVTVSSLIPAPQALVYAAWTNAEPLAAWWRPPGGRCTGATMTVEVGGTYEIVNEFPDGTVVTITGEFLEVVPPESLTYTWGTGAVEDCDQSVKVTFESHPEGTMVTVCHERIPTAEERAGHRLGWNSCIDGLIEHCATIA